MTQPAFQAPHGLAEIRRVYGDISIRRSRMDPKDWEISTPGWESRNMVLATITGLPRQVYILRAMVGPLERAMVRCLALGDGYQVRTAGTFCPRPKRTVALDPGHAGELSAASALLSMHSWGAAIDLNAATNPLAKARGDQPQTDIPQGWVDAFLAEGFTPGRLFLRPDPMHFQLASGY